MRVLSFLTALFASITLASTTPFTFDEFKQEYNKQYISKEEETMRKAIYEHNLRYIFTENQKEHTYKLGVNEYADLTTDEFFGNSRRSSNYQKYTKYHKHFNKSFSVINNDDLPTEIDWTTKNAVTPIKNQGQCGSCWSFSTTGSIEGINAITSGNLISLSEQQLVDCSTEYGNQGCNGGMPIWAYQYVIDNGGICSESSYPYTGQDGSCQKCNPVVEISGYVNVTANSGDALKTALSKQPVSVIIEADQMTFQFYSSGVLTSGCGNNLDHAVLAVGYGTNSNGQEYLKIKNSWGTSWGLNGYILLGFDSSSNSQNGGSGVCGVLSMPTYPTM